MYLFLFKHLKQLLESLQKNISLKITGEIRSSEAEIRADLYEIKELLSKKREPVSGKD